ALGDVDADVLEVVRPCATDPDHIVAVGDMVLCVARTRPRGLAHRLSSFRLANATVVDVVQGACSQPGGVPRAHGPARRGGVSGTTVVRRTRLGAGPGLRRAYRQAVPAVMAERDGP